MARKCDENVLGYAVDADGHILPIQSWIGDEGEVDFDRATACVVRDGDKCLVLDLKTGELEPVS